MDNIPNIGPRRAHEIAVESYPYLVIRVLVNDTTNTRSDPQPVCWCKTPDDAESAINKLTRAWANYPAGFPGGRYEYIIIQVLEVDYSDDY